MLALKLSHRLRLNIFLLGFSLFTLNQVTLGAEPTSLKNNLNPLAVKPTSAVKPKTTFQTVSFYAEYQDHAVRWPDGVVNIFDKSGFSQWDIVTKRLQPFLGNTKLATTTTEANANIIVEGVDSLPMPYTASCGVTQHYLGRDNASIEKAIIKIRKIPLCIGDGQELGLYMHEVGHALGFSRHTKDKDVMGIYENRGKEIHIQTLSAFLTGLYSLPVGTPYTPEMSFDLLDFPTDWDVATGNVLTPASIYADNSVKDVVSASSKVHDMPPSIKSTWTPTSLHSNDIGEKVKVPESRTYVPIGSITKSKMHEIQIIGPNGFESRWEAIPN